ncbi:MAG: calcium-binding protein [Salaquimonas sp.]
MTKQAAANSNFSNHYELFNCNINERIGKHRSTRRGLALATTAITGIAALLASTLENRATEAPETDNQDFGQDFGQDISSNIDRNPTASLPNHTESALSTQIDAQIAMPEAFESVQAKELDEANTQLANLFGSFEATGDNENTAESGEKLLSGSSATHGISPVISLGVSDPTQPIGDPTGANSVTPLVYSPVTSIAANTNASSATKHICDTEETETGKIINGTQEFDNLQGTKWDDVIFAMDGNDIISGGLGADQIDGGEGFDTIDYSSSSEAVNIDLAKTTQQGGDAQGDTLTGIEAVIGSAHDDVINGQNDATDYIYGGDGNDELYGHGEKDFLTGGAGADYLDGGEGNGDVAEYVTSATGVKVSLKDGKGYAGDAAGDTLVNIEFLHGSLHDDWLEGDDQTNRLEGRLGDDELFGLGGNDRLLGGYGADALDGGEGDDIADYIWSDEGVIVDLSTGIGLGGEAEGDTYISIEFLSGSLLDDVLTGDSGTNRLWGKDGDDILNGGAGNDRLDGGIGADHLNGGEGIDIADYSNATESVSLDLKTGGISGEAKGDTYESIETIYGSAFDDNIAGDDGANRLVGNDGNDILFGADGIDYLIGGAGDDVLIGGDGADVFVFEGEFGDDTITDMWAGASRTDRIWLKGQDIDTWEELQTSMTQSGDHVVLNLDGGSITLIDTMIEDLNMDDFIFG